VEVKPFFWSISGKNDKTHPRCADIDSYLHSRPANFGLKFSAFWTIPTIDNCFYVSVFPTAGYLKSDAPEFFPEILGSAGFRLARPVFHSIQTFRLRETRYRITTMHAGIPSIASMDYQSRLVGEASGYLSLRRADGTGENGKEVIRESRTAEYWIVTPWNNPRRKNDEKGFLTYGRRPDRRDRAFQLRHLR
jgi:hypothetical protein